MERAQALVVSLLALGLMLSPLLRHPDEDSFPLSTFPMFSRERPRTMTLTHAVGVDAEGKHRPIPPRVSADTGEVLQSMRTIELSVSAGRAMALCSEIAARAAAHEELGAIERVVIETITFDAVAYFDDDPPDVEARMLHAVCRVLR